VAAVTRLAVATPVVAVTHLAVATQVAAVVPSVAATQAAVTTILAAATQAAEAIQVAEAIPVVPTPAGRDMAGHRIRDAAATQERRVAAVATSDRDLRASLISVLAADREQDPATPSAPQAGTATAVT